jgi:signal transduction histidine kinase
MCGWRKKSTKKHLDIYCNRKKFLLQANYQDQLESTLKSISDCYQGLGDYKKSLDYLQKYSALHDTLNAIAKTEATARLERKYSLAQKEKEIQLLNQEKVIRQEETDHQRLLKNIFIGGVAVLLLIAFLLWNRYRLKRRTSVQLEEKNLVIQQEKERADELRKRAEQSEKFKSQFLANMSHEIRTPMNAIMGLTNLMMDEEDEGKRIQYLSAVKKSSENLLVILNDILDLSKLEAGKVELEKIPFRIGEPFHFVYETLQLKAREKGLQWKLNIDEQLPPIFLGDPARLIQVLLNLAGNAMKFTERGSVEMTVKSLSKEIQKPVPGKPTQIKISIIDTGIGIPKEKVDTIFQSFTQANTSDNRKYGGTGLGLSISKTLVELMGGTLEVESKENVGSIFSFEVAFEIGTEEQLLARHKDDLTFGEDIGEQLDGIRILVAEDNEYNQMLIVDTLHKFIPNVTVDVCTNGKQLVEMMKSGDFSRKSEVGSRRIKSQESRVKSREKKARIKMEKRRPLKSFRLPTSDFRLIQTLDSRLSTTN